MMNFFEPQRLRIDIDAENWVEVRKLTFGEVQDITAKFATYDEASGRTVVLDSVGVGNAVILASVCDWGGPGFDGRPVTPENVRDLPPSIVAQFAEATNRLNSDLSDDEKKV